MAFTPDLLRRIVVLAGPTAGGKTDVSLDLARLIDAEVLALDSMTVYRGMDVGTAKIAPGEQQGIPHHLLDLVDPWEEFSVADYVNRAAAVCREILGRGRRPLFVGGSGLYLRSMLRGLFDGPPASPAVRERIARRIAAEGLAALHAELTAVDPIAAGRIHPQDERRITRALEVYEVTGRPLSSQWAEQTPRPVEERTPHIYWLSPPREWLYDRINRRARVMLERGWLDEVDRLRAAPHPISQTARQALGYQELWNWREGGGAGTPPAAVVESIRTRTRQFSKRQLTWFRNLEECVPVPIDGTESPRSIAEAIARRIED